MGIEQEISKASGVKIRALRDSGEGRRDIRGLSGVCSHGVTTGAPALRQLLPLRGIGCKSPMHLKTKKRRSGNENPDHRYPLLFRRFIHGMRYSG
jgi:hypothetical protein